MHVVQCATLIAPYTALPLSLTLSRLREKGQTRRAFVNQLAFIWLANNESAPPARIIGISSLPCASFTGISPRPSTTSLSWPLSRPEVSGETFAPRLFGAKKNQRSFLI